MHVVERRREMPSQMLCGHVHITLRTNDGLQEEQKTKPSIIFLLEPRHGGLLLDIWHRVKIIVLFCGPTTASSFRQATFKCLEQLFLPNALSKWYWVNVETRCGIQMMSKVVFGRAERVPRKVRGGWTRCWDACCPWGDEDPKEPVS